MATKKKQSKVKLNSRGEPVKLKIYAKINDYLKVKKGKAVYYLQITNINDHFVNHRDASFDRRTCICISPLSTMYLSKCVKVLTAEEYLVRRDQLDEAKRAKKLVKDMDYLFRYLNYKDLVNFNESLGVLMEKAKKIKAKDKEDEF